MTTEPDFGWSYPPTFSLGGKSLQRTWGAEDLDISLGLLLSTRPGDHPIYPDFGCSLEEFMFQQMDQNMFNIVQHRISRSIRQYEPRITLDTVEVEPDEAEGKLFITVNYIVKATGLYATFSTSISLFP